MSFTHRIGARLGRAWKYASGKLSTDDALQIIDDCRATAGWHPLLVLTVDDALKHIRDVYIDHPQLRRLASRACAEIESKCGGALKDQQAAKEWASKLTRTYAKDEGLILTKWEDVLPRRLFERPEPPPQLQPVSRAPGWSPGAAELLEQAGETTLSFDGANGRLRGDLFLAAALDFNEEAAAAE